MKKWDIAIGNPAYQQEQESTDIETSSKNYASPVYNFFLDEAFKVADSVEMIHPARFLFNAGSTPKAWNEKMLQDEHFKILSYIPDSDEVFPGLSTPIKGGIVISYRNSKQKYGPIVVFTQFPQLNSISHKVTSREDFVSLCEIVYSRTSFRLTDTLHREIPSAINKLSDGHAYDMSSNIFQRLPEVFHDSEPKDGRDYIEIIGRDNNQRISKFIRKDYVNTPENLYAYKVYVAQANGSGGLGETMSPPIVSKPGVGSTETFLSIGCFDTVDEANALEKYIKTKFLRVLLSILKVTQNGNKPVWKMIPLQDFTTMSDINWLTSIKNIDKQLYKKYGLSQEEIDFIETHVKEMT